ARRLSFVGLRVAAVGPTIPLQRFAHLRAPGGVRTFEHIEPGRHLKEHPAVDEREEIDDRRRAAEARLQKRRGALSRRAMQLHDQRQPRLTDAGVVEAARAVTPGGPAVWALPLLDAFGLARARRLGKPVDAWGEANRDVFEVGEHEG